MPSNKKQSEEAPVGDAPSSKSTGEEESMSGGSHDQHSASMNSGGSSTSKSGSGTLSRSNNTGTGSGSDSQDNDSPSSQPGRDKWVRRLRVTVLLVLVLAGSATCAVVYFSLRASETNEFETRFQDQSSHVGHALHAEMSSKLSAMDNLAINIEAYAIYNSQGWPKITMPEFAYRATSALIIGRGLSTALYPVVYNHTRAIWEEYSIANQGWRDEGLVFQELFPDALGGGGGHMMDMDMGHRLLRLQQRKAQLEMEMGEMNMNKINNTGTNMMEGNHTGTSNMDPMDDGHAGMDMEGHDAGNMDVDGHQDGHDSTTGGLLAGISENIFQVIDGIPVSAEGDFFLPLWQHAEVHDMFPWVNFDIHTDPLNNDAIDVVFQSQEATVGRYFDLADGDSGHNFPYVKPEYKNQEHAHFHRSLQDHDHGDTEIEMDMDMDMDMDHGDTEIEMDMDMDHGDSDTSDHDGHGGMDMGPDGHDMSQEGPASAIWYPLFDTFNDERNIMAMLSMTFRWDSVFTGSLPPNPNGIVVVVENTCEQTFSFEITGQEVIYLGPGDQHEPGYEQYQTSFLLSNSGSSFTGIPLSNTFCPYQIHVYPSEQMEAEFRTSRPLTFTVGIGAIFVFTSVTFILYDFLVERRKSQLKEKADKSNAIVSALFPEVVRERLFEGAEGKEKADATNRGRMKNFLTGGTDQREDVSKKTAPIADLFPDATVMFGDIAGFTAWASSREPSQVFILLETLYGAFDQIANRMHVFKVETIGDCYVAVTGLPTPQSDHATRIVRFAKACLLRMAEVTEELELTLGPDTVEMGFRLGLHSGPVTAGVLRGEKSRFQLFGDTVNTASRMESTSIPNCIQISQSTADLLVRSGKSSWITKRKELVQAKGKGEVQTYWVKITKNKGSADMDMTSKSLVSFSQRSRHSKDIWGKMQVQDGSHRQRLIDWQVEVLSKLLKQIVANRGRKRTKTQRPKSLDTSKTNPRDEMAESITMPTYDPKQAKYAVNPESVELEENIVSQLQDMVTTVAMMYHNNPFHNYDHACHVTMSSNKLMGRVTSAESADSEERLHEYTYGLTSDPMTQFAIVFSAMIHDLDHPGVTNGQLSKENNRLATLYGSKSVAEQNSIDLAWEILTASSYEDLIACICPDEAEYKRFRQLVVNCIMATDIFDKELLDFRNQRWHKAFHEDDDGSSDQEKLNLKATIVIEHIIQAADVAHTMQHWHVYTKWNERLFAEMYAAYKSGRGGDKDPSEGWYGGELWFYDNYVIPLARKLAECNVFGVCSAECLTYALENRKEWERKGKDIVEYMVNKYKHADTFSRSSHSRRDSTGKSDNFSEGSMPSQSLASFSNNDDD